MKHLIQFQTLLRQLAVLVVFNSIAFVSFAQNENSAKEYEIIATDNSKQPTFIRFSETKIKADDKSVFEFLVNQYGFDENTTFVEKEGSAKEQNGIFSKKLFQYYKGIQVEFGQLIITHKDSYLRTVNGHITPTKNLNLKPSISEKEALESALKQINAKEYAWENEGFENLLRTEEENPKATYYPKAELVIIDKGLFEEKTDVRLAYKFDIYATYPISRQDYYVDAHTGEQVFQNTTLMHASGDTRYSGRREFVTRVYNSMFRLRDYTRGLGIETYNMNNGSNYQAATDFTDRDNNWTAAEYDNAQKDNAALDAHWGAEMTYDYFLKFHNRNSWDDNGAKIRSYVHTNLMQLGFGSNANAFWDGSRMTYGDGDNNIDPFTSIDIVAHEIGHAVCQRTASLIYQKEQGAINESLSDIWGAMVKYYADPNKQTYQHGYEIYTNGGMSRSLSNPKLRNQPDTYKGDFWKDTENCQPNAGLNDDCWVHTNSGVMNKWFYLLAEGGKGVNDVKNYYTVYGIGKEDAAKIVYRAEAVYFESRTNYEEARMWTMQAAMDLYGVNSHQLYAVCLAWYAVGLGEYKDICNTSVILRGDENLCDRGTRAYELVFLPPTATVTWEVSPNLEIFTPGRENIAVRINPNQPISQSLGNGYVIAYVDGVPIWKNTWVGYPQIRLSETPPYIVYPDPFPTNSPFHKDLYLLGTNGTNIQSQGITSTNWELIGSSGECTPIFNVENDYQATLDANCENWTAQVEVSATNGCGTTTESITVQVVPQVYCYYLDIWTGQITIRPCENRREATTNSEKISKVSLHNYMGVHYGTYENTDTFPISKLPIGVYFVKIQLESGYIFTLKFIK